MDNVTLTNENGKTVIALSGRVDSNNAPDLEKKIAELISGAEVQSPVLDFDDLEYISSAGLRLVLHLRKLYSDLSIVNVRSEVYDVLDMTGFTEMMPVSKAYRRISVDGCEVIGHGANGTLYRIDSDSVVKVYNNPEALEEIRHEREVARRALILGIPTAISYDVVRVGDNYGSVFELLNARSFSDLLADEPERLDWCVQEYVELLKKIHGTQVKPGALPDMRETVLGWARFMQDHLPQEAGSKLLSLVEAVPYDDHMLHGDYHTKNVVVQNDEVLLIDMDTLAVGNPIFELASMFNAYVGFYELDPEAILKFQGYSLETAKTFWNKTLRLYLNTESEDRVREVEDKARILGYTRMIRRSIRRNGLNIEAEQKKIAHWTAELLELLDRTDTLLFSANEIEVEAVSDNLPKVMDFVGQCLDENNCPMKTRMQIDMAVEEIFINIASYAYSNSDRIGNARIRVETCGDPLSVVLTFIDNGMPYDPLARTDPDVTLSAEERSVGGLGIFLVKNTMDDVHYEYKDGQNILTLKKNLQ